MIKKTIKFKDLDGNDVEEEFYFNMTKAEAMELNFSHKGGLEEHVKKIIETKNMQDLIALFKELIVKTVGKRSEDGRRFIKNEEITNDFVQTEAYSELFMQLAGDAQFAIQFVRGIMPADIQSEIDKMEALQQSGETEEQSTVEPAWVTEGRTPSPEELKNATPEQIQLAFERKLSVQQAAVSSTPSIPPPDSNN